MRVALVTGGSVGIGAATNPNPTRGSPST